MHSKCRPNHTLLFNYFLKYQNGLETIFKTLKTFLSNCENYKMYVDSPIFYEFSKTTSHEQCKQIENFQKFELTYLQKKKIIICVQFKIKHIASCSLRWYISRPTCLNVKKYKIKKNWKIHVKVNIPLTYTTLRYVFVYGLIFQNHLQVIQ